jgi:hypothetical protein
VSVAKLVEADLQVASHGGPVQVVSVRGGSALMDTRCPAGGPAGSLQVGGGGCMAWRV